MSKQSSAMRWDSANSPSEGHDIFHRGQTDHARTYQCKQFTPKARCHPFAKLEDAKTACKGLPYASGRETETDSGYVLVDVTLLYPQISVTDEFQIRSSLIPGELGEPATKNLFWDHRGADQQTPYGVEGLIDTPILISPPK